MLPKKTDLNAQIAWNHANA